MVHVKEDIFGIAVNPITNMAQVVRRYTMTNNSKVSVSVLQMGATIQSVRTPDAHHVVDEICLGFDDISGYLAHHNFLFGPMLGRIAEQVSNGEFIMDERKVLVTRNLHGVHHVNGGNVGFDRIIWDLHELMPDGVTLRHVSPHGHEGYPGELTVLVHFHLDEDNRFTIRVEANTNRTTAVNITNHTHFNLAGHKAGSKGLYEHTTTVPAANYIEVDKEQLPTGRYLPVDNTENDLRLSVCLGDRLRRFENRACPGFDVCFALRKDFDEVKTCFAGRFMHPPSGRYMDVYSNQPGMHLRTANFFPNELRGDEPIMGKNCTRYWRHCAFSLQMQKFPDSVNQLDFPTIFIMPQEKYFHETIYRFGVQESWKCCASAEDLIAMGLDPLQPHCRVNA